MPYDQQYDQERASGMIISRRGTFEVVDASEMREEIEKKTVNTFKFVLVRGFTDVAGHRHKYKK